MARTATNARYRAAFTLIELLVVVAILSLLVAIVLPSLQRARELGKAAVCSANLRSLHTAFVLYLEENAEEFFPYQESVTGGILWYWGLENTSVTSSEGSRPIDSSRARLARYLSPDGRTTMCPSLPPGYPNFKPKFALAGYGYALNRTMLRGLPQAGQWRQLTQPSQTITWADAAQINTWQAPASPSHPMLEEFYYLDDRQLTPATFHFRHSENCYSAFSDGSVRPLEPVWLDSRCDGLMGRPELAVAPNNISSLLRLDK